MIFTMLKLLTHGTTVMKRASLPIGMLFEEATKARNKHFRLYRMNFARKFSRKQCNLDVLNRLRLSSDPLITSMRPKPKRKLMPHRQEAMKMFISDGPHTDDELFRRINGGNWRMELWRKDLGFFILDNNFFCYFCTLQCFLFNVPFFLYQIFLFQLCMFIYCFQQCNSIIEIYPCIMILITSICSYLIFIFR